MNSAEKQKLPDLSNLAESVRSVAADYRQATLNSTTLSRAPSAVGTMEITVGFSVETATGIRLMAEICQLLQKANVSKLAISGSANPPEVSGDGASSMAK
jgi:hypothetical protein